MFDWDDEGEDELDEVEEDADEEDLAAVERWFHDRRELVRGCTDLQVLSWLRTTLRSGVSAGSLQGAAQVRATDLIGLIDDRITDLRAQQIVDRRS